WVFVGTWRGAQFTPVTGGSRRLDPTGGVVDYALDFTGPALAAGEDFQVIVYADGDAAVDAMRLVEVVE
ncbi:MAG: hypothetical protein KC620_22130, partial [Myxococcales bacterium]|nr:hypothetical protein [Myxococcales bacterium]